MTKLDKLIETMIDDMENLFTKFTQVHNIHAAWQGDYTNVFTFSKSNKHKQIIIPDGSRWNTDNNNSSSIINTSEIALCF